MIDYIKREDAIEQARRNWIGEGEWIASTEIQLLKNLPSADVVEVVRCMDCEHFEAINNDDHGWCKMISDLPCGISVRYDDDFCSYGERAEE